MIATHQTNLLPTSLSFYGTPDSASSLVVIDAAVDLAVDLAAAIDPSAVAIILDRNQDGIWQIRAALDCCPQVSAIHLLAHATPGCLNLGNSQLTVERVEQYPDFFTSLAKRQIALYLYGCRVAADHQGARFIQQLYQLTGSAIAASTTLTGNPILGGDWDLSCRIGFRSGEVAAALPITPALLAAYSGLLNAPVITDQAEITKVERATNEGTATTITGIAIEDTSLGNLTVTLNVDQGQLTLASTSGLTVTNNGSGSVTLVGLQADINAALSGMTYRPTATMTTVNGRTDEYSGLESLRINVTNSLSATALKTIALNITPVNDAPSIVPVAATVLEGGNVTFTTGNFGIVDLDNLDVQVIVKINSLPGKGYLTLNGARLVPDSTFSLEDIPNLVYHHDGTQTTDPGGLNDAFSITVDDGAGGAIGVTPIPISITPVNQLPQVTAVTGIVEGQSAPVSIAIQDGDQLAASHTITVLSLPEDGVLYFNGTAVTIGQTLTSDQLAQLTFTHDGNDKNFGYPPDSTFQVQITDDGGGTATPGSVTSTVRLTFKPNNDDPLLVNNRGLTYNTSDQPPAGVDAFTRLITASELRVSDPDSPTRYLVYTLKQTVDTSLGQIQLLVGSQWQALSNGSSFTQDDVDQQRLRYVFYRAEAGTFTDSFKFEVRDSEVTEFLPGRPGETRNGGIWLPDGSALAEMSFNIQVTTQGGPGLSTAPTLPANTTPVEVIVDQAATDEGGLVGIAKTMLEYSDVDTPPDQIVYRIVKLPTSGKILVDGRALGRFDSFTQQEINSGKVQFQHNGSEDLSDSFRFTVSDGTNVTDEREFKLEMTPVNDRPTIAVQGKPYLVEGGTIRLSDVDFSVFDEDGTGEKVGQGYATPNLLTFKVTELPQHGLLQVERAGSWVTIDQNTILTKAELDGKNLRYIHDDTETIADSFKVQANDNTTNPTNPTNNFSDTVTIEIEIAQLNDPPQFSTAKLLTVDEAGLGTIKGSNGITGNEPHLVYVDPDNSTLQRQYRVTSGVVNGQLLLNGKALSVGSIFTQKDLDENRITYRHSGSETTSDRFEFQVSDGSGSSVPGSYDIVINPTNDAPELTVPGSQLLINSNTLSFTAGNGRRIVVTDPDLVSLQTGEVDILKVTLDLRQGGTTFNDAVLTLGSSTGLTVLSQTNGKIVFEGTRANVQAALDGLQLQTLTDVDGTLSLVVTVDDRLNGDYRTDLNVIAPTGAIVTKTINISASQVNDPAQITAPASATVNEDGALLFNGGAGQASPISIQDVDDFGQPMTVQISVGAGAGHLNATGAAGNGTNQITLTGSKDQINTALAGLSFTPTANANGPVNLTVNVLNDGGGTNVASHTVAITVNPLNDTPVLTAPSAVQTLSTNNPLTFTGGAIAINDNLDLTQGAADSFTVTVEAKKQSDGSSYGRLSATASGAASVGGVNTNILTITGTQAEINAVLNSLSYVPDDFNVDQVVDLVVTVNDSNNGAEGTGSIGQPATATRTIVVNVSGTNDAPVLAPPTAAITVNEDSSVTLTGANRVFVVSDPDDFGANDLVATVTVERGRLTLAGNDGTAVTGSNTSTLTLTGTEAQINAALDGLIYTPDANYHGQAKLEVKIDDRGNTGTGGAKSDTESIFITVIPINDRPVASGSATLAAVAEDNTDPTGAAIGTLLTGNYSDSTDNQTVNGGGNAETALSHVAIIGSTGYLATQGVWQFKNDLGNWIDIPTTGLSITNALVIRADRQIRFRPAANFHGTPGSLSLRLADSSIAISESSSASDRKNASTIATGAWSNSSVTLNTTVTTINDAPTIDSPATAAMLASINEDITTSTGSDVSALFGSKYLDTTDNQSSITGGGNSATGFGGIAIVGNAASVSEGVWQYSTNGGTNWTAIANTGLGNTSALLLPTTARLRFVPAADYNGSPGALTVRFSDSAVTFNPSADISSTVGSTGNWSATTTTLSTTINPVNDAPVLSGTGVTGNYTEQLVGLSVGANLTGISDLEITRGERLDLLTATVRITDFVAGDRLSFTLGSTGVIVTDSGTGTYTLSSASRANLLQVMQSAVYSSTSDNPTNFDAVADRNRTIEFRIDDNNGGTNLSNIVTSTVNVIAVNDAPDAINDTNTIAEETASVTGNVRSNDTDPDNLNGSLLVSEVNGVTGNVGQTIAGKYGSLRLNSNGTYTYTLDNSNPAVQALSVGKSLADEVFNYTIFDGALTDSATLTITVTGTNDAPVAVADTNSGVEDGPPITGTVLPNDSDRDTGDTLTVNRVNGSLANVGQAVTGSYGTLTLNANGTYSYAINNSNTTVQALGVGESISESFTYQISDGQGGTSSSTLTITIDGTNDAPVAQPNSQISIVGQPAATGNVLGNDSDIDGDPLTVTELTFGGNPVPLGSPFDSSYGRLTLNADGSYSYQADASNPALIALAEGQTLTETFTYQISDGQGGTSTANLTLTIRGINDGPVAVLDTNTISEDAATPATGNVLVNDSDIDQDSLSVVAVNGAGANVANPVSGLYGTLTLNANGSYSYALNNANSTVQALGVGESITDSFSYQISDGKGGTSTTNVVITINGTNDGPVAMADTNSVNEDGAAIGGNVLPNDTDRDTNDVLTVSAVNGNVANLGNAITGSYGSLILNADGSYSYSLDSSKPSVQALGVGESLTDSFTYTVSDGKGGTASTTLTITINGTNDGPVANPDATTISEDAVVPATGNVLPNDSDIDGDTLTIVAVNGGTGNVGNAITGSYGSLTLNSDGSYSYAVNNSNATVQALGVGESIDESFTYRISDGQGGTSTATLTITINGTNDDPAARLDSQSLTEDGSNTATGNALVNDSDIDGDPLAVTQVNGQNANLGQTVNGSYGSLVLNGDGNYSYVLDAANSAVQSLAVGETVTDSFSYQISDGQGGFSTAQIQITINGSNDGPVAVADSNTIAEDAVNPAVGNVLTDAAGRDRDLDTSDTLTVVQVNGSSANVGSSVTGSYGNLVLNATGAYSYQINNANGAVQALGVSETLTETFSYQISDGKGGFDTTSLTITITGTNDDPIALADSTMITEAEFSVDPTRTGTVLSNDRDIDGDPLVVSAVGGSSAAVGQTVTGQYGSLVLNADGTYSYSVDVNNATVQGLGQNESLTETFTYEISDGQGGTDSATLTITIGGQNSGPTAVNDKNVIAEDQTLVAGNVLTNPTGQDTDPDINDSLTVVQVNSSPANVGQPLVGSYGSLTLNSDGSYSYSLDNSNQSVQALSVGESLSETFTYQIADRQGATSIATLTITIDGTNDAPIASADLASIFEDAANPVLGNLLPNDSDLDGDGLSVSQVNDDPANLGQPVLGSYGSLTLKADGSYSYSLDSSILAVQQLAVGQSLTDQFTYQISDGQGGFDRTTLTITINGSNDGPVAVADSNTIFEDASSPTSGNVITDLGGADSDLDGDSLTVVQVNSDSGQVGQPVVGSYGSLTLNADGSYSYSLDNSLGEIQALSVGETRLDQFTYQISDGQGGTSTATLTITIQGTNDAPVAQDDANTVIEDGADAMGNLLPNDSDPDGDSLAVVEVNGDSAQVGQPVVGQYGSLTLNADGSYSYSLDPTNAAVQALGTGETLSESFTYQISDGQGGTAEATLTLTINGVNDGVVAVADTNTITEDATDPVQETVLPNDSDIDGDPLQVSQVNADSKQVGQPVVGLYGTLVLNQDGTYSYQIDNSNATVQALGLGETLTDQFTYQITDGTSTSSTSLTLTITGSNDTPEAADDFNQIAEDATSSATGNVLFNDFDRDTTDKLRVTQLGVEDSPLDPTLVGIALNGQYGSLILNADGSYSYQVDRNNPFVQSLPPGQTLTERFEYEMSDGTSFSSATLTITIGENDAPVSQDQTVTTLEDQPYVFLPGDFAFSDKDQGDQISLVRIDSLPAEGQLSLNGTAVTAGQEISISEIADGNLTFVPVENANGDAYAQFQFSVKDSSDKKNAYSASPNILTVNVTPVNDPPQLDLDGNDSAAPGQDYRTRFVPGQPVAVADLDTQISDLDNSQIQSALITLTNRPNGSSEFLTLAGNLPAGITASAYDPTTGELRLTGSASLTDYQTALASLVYSNTAAVRDSRDRQVTVVVFDGEASSNLAQTLISYDTDGDGIIDQLDLDMDNDGIPNAIEMGDNPNRDTDGDGILDLLDLDSDDDGLTDLRETGLSDQVWQTLDRDGDGVIDSSNAFGSNGLADTVETTADSGSLKQSPLDTDQDGKPDFQDQDSDNDGFSDLLESGLGFSDSNGDGQVDGPDQDGDGIRDGADRRVGLGGGSNQIWADRNSSGIPDHREISRRRSGSTDSDLITGTDGDDILSGFSDLDVISGRGGNDIIVGGSDKDRLFGDQGNDQISGGSNDDWIEGGTENDIINGGTGNDRIFGGDGDDIINAGQGNDWASGDGGNDRITGNEGNDKLLGGAGNDLLLGDRGNDLLQGGLSKDRLTGGQGKDRFVYSSVREFGDVVMDFEIVKDQFDLSALFPGKAGSMSNIRVKQQGQDALVQVNAGQGFRNLATLEDVEANTLDQRHFKF